MPVWVNGIQFPEFGVPPGDNAATAATASFSKVSLTCNVNMKMLYK